MANIFPGDEGVVRVKVKDVKGDHVLVDSVSSPVREFWFPATYFERSAQGAASLDNEKRLAAAGAAAAPEPSIAPGTGTAIAVDEAGPSQRELAIAHVMSKDYDRVAAEKIVEEVGTRTILADRDDEVREAREAADRKQREQEKAAKATRDAGDQNQASTGADKPV